MINAITPAQFGHGRSSQHRLFTESMHPDRNVSQRMETNHSSSRSGKPLMGWQSGQTVEICWRTHTSKPVKAHRCPKNGLTFHSKG